MQNQIKRMLLCGAVILYCSEMRTNFGTNVFTLGTLLVTTAYIFYTQGFADCAKITEEILIEDIKREQGNVFSKKDPVKKFSDSTFHFKSKAHIEDLYRARIRELINHKDQQKR